jgi:hypothetical protein
MEEIHVYRKDSIHLILVVEMNRMRDFSLQAITTFCKKVIYDLFFLI